MILEMKVPSPGESITEVEIAEWLVQDGDYVEKDQAIAEVDSDKATLELPAEASGTITLKAEEGDAVEVGAVVCLIDTAAEPPEGGESIKEEKVKEQPVKKEEPKPVSETKTYATGTASPAAKKVHFKFSTGSNHFFEIAKLRAFRALWKALLKEHNQDDTVPHIFTEPSSRNKTIYNSELNLFRTTSECLSGILGGSDTINNFSKDSIYKKSNKASEEEARNQLLILKKEIGTKSPQLYSEGNYFIENSTEQLAEKAIEIFKLIENGGGFLKQLKEGIIQKKINESAEKEQQLFDEGKLLITGANITFDDNQKIKNDIELFPFVKTRPQKTLLQPIIAKRLAEQLEKKSLDNE